MRVCAHVWEWVSEFICICSFNEYVLLVIPLTLCVWMWRENEQIYIAMRKVTDICFTMKMQNLNLKKNETENRLWMYVINGCFYVFDDKCNENDSVFQNDSLRSIIISLIKCNSLLLGHLSACHRLESILHKRVICFLAFFVFVIWFQMWLQSCTHQANVCCFIDLPMRKQLDFSF